MQRKCEYMLLIRGHLPFSPFWQLVLALGEFSCPSQLYSQIMSFHLLYGQDLQSRDGARGNNCLSLSYWEIANMKITRFGAIGGVYLAENTILCYFFAKKSISVWDTPKVCNNNIEDTDVIFGGKHPYMVLSSNHLYFYFQHTAG